MTEQELILKLQQLKLVKPNNDWVVLTKSQILGAEFTGLKIFHLFDQRKLAYAFSALLMVIFAGVFGFTHYTPQPQPAAILGESSIKSNIETFKIKSQNLAIAAKDTNNTTTKQTAVKELKAAATSLAAAIGKDPSVAKTVALELKQDGTLAALSSGSDTKETSDIVYKALVEQLFKDEAKATPQEERQKVVADAKALYEQGEFGQALILLINN